MRIKIHGHKFKVEFVDGEIEKMKNPEENHYNLGLTEYLDSTISIRKGMTEIVTRETVIHELVHVFIFVYGYDVDNEEAMCDFFGAHGDRIIRLTDKIMKGGGKDECK